MKVPIPLKIAVQIPPVLREVEHDKSVGIRKLPLSDATSASRSTSTVPPAATISRAATRSEDLQGVRARAARAWAETEGGR
jgi:hypothetical protein